MNKMEISPFIFYFLPTEKGQQLFHCLHPKLADTFIQDAEIIFLPQDPHPPLCVCIMFAL